MAAMPKTPRLTFNAAFEPLMPKAPHFKPCAKSMIR